MFLLFYSVLCRRLCLARIPDCVRSCSPNLHVTVNCSATGSTASKSEEFELTAGGHEDATSTTALAGSLVSNAAATDVVETVSDTAAAADAEALS